MGGYKFLLASRWAGLALLSIYGLFDSERAYAYIIKYEDISNSYSNCHYKVNSTYTTVSTTIDFKKAYASSAKYVSRGILLYNYDKYGNALNTASVDLYDVKINGKSASLRYGGQNYVIYAGFKVPDEAFVANVVVDIANRYLSEWPAMSIRAGAYTNGDDVGEVKGGAYITFDRNGTGGSGVCRVIVDPGIPPALDISITVSAPDWNLGELPQGTSDTQLSRTDQQLCFSYDAGDFQEKYIIGASNANGVVNNRYQLRHLSNISQVVPYSLMLDSGGTRIQLPNNNTAIPLDRSGRTCFVPTFRTEVGNTVKEGEGDYSDVLTFTVTAKS